MEALASAVLRVPFTGGRLGLRWILDKASRLYANPTPAQLPRRVWQRGLQLLHLVGVYRLPSTPLYRNFDEALALRLQPDEHLTRRLWFGGYVEYDEENLVRAFLRPGMTAIDGGANVGHMSLICARRVRPGGHVHAFEPVPGTFAILRENVEVNGLEETVRVHRFAFADRSDELVRIECQEQYSNMAHMALGNDRDSAAVPTHSGADSRAEPNPGGNVRVSEVSTVTLDDYVAREGLERVDFLKLDLEGAETMALAGARRLLGVMKPVVLCEFNNPTLVRFGSSSHTLWRMWRELGYEFFDYRHRERTLSPRCLFPEHDYVTVVGTTDVDGLVRRLGARLT